MKKKILLLLLGALLFIAFPKTVSASCAPNPGTRCNLTNCPTSGGLYCCGSPADCTALQSGQPVDITTRPTITSVDIHCGSDTSISTAIGCIDFGNQSAFLGSILRWAVGIGGGIAFLLMVYAGFMIMTAAGNPERLKAGQELMTSAISGLILLIFSVFVLKFIGIDILGLGQFGFGAGSTTPIGGPQPSGFY